MAAVVVIVETGFTGAVCPMEDAARGAAGVSGDGEFEPRATGTKVIAVISSSDASGNPGSGNWMRGGGTVSATLRVSY
jgi:hypothetical protein